MTTTIKNGTIINANEHIIAHQVNGLGVMGGGVARQIKKAYPGVYRRYKTFVDNHTSPEELLGRNLMIVTDGNPVYQYDKSGDSKIISNLFGQAHIGTSQKQTDEKALRKALEHLAEFAKMDNLSVAMPEGIGCGRGGGNWNEIQTIIKEVFGDYPVTLYRYTE
ncbi:macro domain-containing protein [Salipaludibacillus agaradhaerens]|jgi:O-acetyl-ADP-ribose deacetylase (regulator of RNase III)|uniref:macro domain-containing protein n=1 Tax=Salipaludibacillus agaradhaerens TaxID=76935 RepID=UPI0021515445|nr:macro domain-containing protein [Salipaludibacillus agaradhaerens]MCR6108628.1 macro domain-containing protein [Salipaludibacillus agaradhaerens]MCR6120654.1 macro domain-containing protein [Salipaludibacillus agaradhaerens]